MTTSSISNDTPERTGSVSFKCFRILYATQSGRAKACARRVARVLRENTTLRIVGGLSGDTFDNCVSKLGTKTSIEQFAATLQQEQSLLVLFVSTTGDGEHTDSIKQTWKQLLQKSLPHTLFQNVPFAMFCLGDRSYGPQFCAAGRKLAVRLLQLGATSYTNVGYGDDLRSGGGVWADLDDWIQDELLPKLETASSSGQDNKPLEMDLQSAKVYSITIGEKLKFSTNQQEIDMEQFSKSYHQFMHHFSPANAYSYDCNCQRSKNVDGESTMLVAQTVINKRMTPMDWNQDTRHFQFSVQPFDSNKHDEAAAPWGLENLPYTAGDVASIYPCNSFYEVDRFISVLPTAIQEIVDHCLNISYNHTTSFAFGVAYPYWPQRCTLRGLLTFAADIHALPEREDLRALGYLCSLQHENGTAQAEKLVHLSETKGSALYVDYILREKRTWADVLYDFDSLRHENSKLTLEILLALLSPIRPREFSIASSPRSEYVQRSTQNKVSSGFKLEFCVAVVEGKTPLGRTHRGLCSSYLSNLVPMESIIRLWIRPGSFSGLPLNPFYIKDVVENSLSAPPVLCIAAGTGIAPIRGLLHERQADRTIASRFMTKSSVALNNIDSKDVKSCEDYLLFGCRQEKTDFYYHDDWQQFQNNNKLTVWTAFSQEPGQKKIYVQQILPQVMSGQWLKEHLIDHHGAIYIAGNPKMARSVKDKITEALTEAMPNVTEKDVLRILAHIQRAGRFSIEAWS